MAIPIPKRPSGYRLGHADAPLVVEMFFDLECPFSKKGWQTMQKVAQTYLPDRMYLILQPMTLSNHRQSWDATKAAIATARDDAEKFVDFVSYVFDRQAEFSGEAFKDKTQTDLHQLLANYAVEASDWQDKAKFVEWMNSQDVYQQARVSARLAARQGVWSTPTFFINGAEATQLSSQSGVKDWQAELDELLAL